MYTPRELIASWKQEFETYLQSRSTQPFAASSETSGAVSALVRELERKRQAGALTDEEQGLLRETDSQLVKIARSIKARGEPRTPAGVGPIPQIYDLPSGVLTDEHPEPSSPAFVPAISGEQAEQIIADLNRQFEEKVLPKLKHPPLPVGGDVGDFAALPASDLPEGRNLHEHASEVRAELPAEPFADEDSQRDLSRIAKPHAG